MKNFLILLLLLIGATSLKAQVTADTVKATAFTYCELVGTQKLFSTKVTVAVDFGQEKKFFQDQRIKDEQTGKIKSFNSMVDALNYMGEDGWGFVQAYIVTTGEINVYHWLLKKRKVGVV